MRRIVHAMNNYFFDVNPNESPDYVGAAIFYGVMALMLIILAILALVTFTGA